MTPPAVPVLDVEHLSVRFRMRGRRHVEAVTDVNLRLAPGTCLALVGESGCGKSVLASALLGLLPENAETAGSARLADGLDLLAADERTLARTVRGRRVGLVPQSPAAHLTPVRTIRSQLEEAVRELTGVRRADLRAAGEAAAERAAFPATHLDRHPHELSGAWPSGPRPPSPSSGTPRCSSPTSRPPASTATSSNAPSTSCAPTPATPAGHC